MAFSFVLGVGAFAVRWWWWLDRGMVNDSGGGGEVEVGGYCGTAGFILFSLLNVKLFQ